MMKRNKKSLLIMIVTILSLTVILSPITFVYAKDSNPRKQDSSALHQESMSRNIGDVLINTTNFPDEIFREYVKKFDKNSDLIFTLDELNNIKTIDVSNKTDCKDLKGIEHFKNLMTLNCANTGITSLDVSKNTSLKTLVCGMTGIKKLDLSKNKVLNMLDCYFGAIESLDVSNNKELDILNCSSTKITTLDISENPLLTTLHCSFTNIESLDVSKNTNLKFLNCEYTEISSLELSENKELTELYCQNTKIISLDLSNNANLHNVKTSTISKRNIIVYSDMVTLQSIDPNMDGSRISNLQNATLSEDKSTFKNFNIEIPISFDYDCQNPVKQVTIHTSLTIFAENDWISSLRIENWTYGDQAKEPIIDSKYGAPKYFYSDTKDGIFTSTVPTNAGTWYVKAIVEATENYSALESEVISFVINKARPNYELPSELAAVYGMQLKDVELPEGYRWVNEMTKVGNVGQNTFAATFTPTDTIDYEIVDVQIKLKISKAQNLWINDLMVKGWTYGQKAEKPTITSIYGTPKYFYSDNKDGIFTSTVPTNAGKWYVKATIEATGNYSGLESKTLTFTISQKSLIDKSIISTDIKNDNDILIVKDGEITLVEGVDYKISNQKAGGTVIIEITGIGNYNGLIKKSYTINNDDKSNSLQTNDISNIITYLTFITFSGYLIIMTFKANKQINK